MQTSCINPFKNNMYTIVRDLKLKRLLCLKKTSYFCKQFKKNSLCSLHNTNSKIFKSFSICSLVHNNNLTYAYPCF